MRAGHRRDTSLNRGLSSPPQVGLDTLFRACGMFWLGVVCGIIILAVVEMLAAMVIRWVNPPLPRQWRAPNPADEPAVGGAARRQARTSTNR